MIEISDAPKAVKDRMNIANKIDLIDPLFTEHAMPLAMYMKPEIKINNNFFIFIEKSSCKKHPNLIGKVGLFICFKHSCGMFLIYLCLPNDWGYTDLSGCSRLLYGLRYSDCFGLRGDRTVSAYGFFQNISLTYVMPPLFFIYKLYHII